MLGDLCNLQSTLCKTLHSLACFIPLGSIHSRIQLFTVFPVKEGLSHLTIPSLVNITAARNDLWGSLYRLCIVIYSPQKLSSCRLNICDSHGQEPMFFPHRALRLSRFLWHISKRWYSFINSSYVLQNYFTVTFCIISCVQTAFLNTHTYYKQQVLDRIRYKCIPFKCAMYE
jgi:hypothetical protein